MAPADWLPPGWTEDMFENATDEQWDALTAEQYQRIIDHEVSEFRAGQAADDQIYGTNYAERPLRPREQEPPGIESNILTALERNNLEEFGFVIFQIHDGIASNIEKLQDLKRVWHTLATDGRLRTVDDNGLTDEQNIPWPVWKWIEERGDGSKPFNIAALIRRYEAVRAEEDIPIGLDQGVFLAITPESLASFTNTTHVSDDDDSYTGPWVYAIDVGYLNNDDDEEEEEDMEDDYEGYFKVSARSLLTDLWPQLAFGALVPNDLGGTIGEGEIWDGVM